MVQLYTYIYLLIHLFVYLFIYSFIYFHKQYEEIVLSPPGRIRASRYEGAAGGLAENSCFWVFGFRVLVFRAGVHGFWVEGLT